MDVEPARTRATELRLEVRTLGGQVLETSSGVLPRSSKSPTSSPVNNTSASLPWFTEAPGPARLHHVPPEPEIPDVGGGEQAPLSAHGQAAAQGGGTPSRPTLRERLTLEERRRPARTRRPVGCRSLFGTYAPRSWWRGVSLPGGTGQSYYQSIAPNYYGVVLGMADSDAATPNYNALIVEKLDGKPVEIRILDTSR